MTTALATKQDSIVAVTSEELALVRETIAKDATPAELKLFLYDCQRQGVHPLDKLLHFTKRAGKYTPITSIDFMRIRAAETGEYAGSDDAVFQSTSKAPEFFAATVTVWRLVQGQRCAFTATARWSEYKPDQAFMWTKMPHTMLGKCAEALALRKGFPRQLAGLYAAEEMDQAERPSATKPAAQTAPLPAAVTQESRENPIEPNGGTSASSMPPGFYLLTNAKRDGDWYEWTILGWDAQGGALKLSTKIKSVIEAASDACDNGIPVKPNYTVKKNTKGEAYLNGVELLANAEVF